MYFYKISESNKSLISTDKPLSELTISAEDGMALKAELKVGDELPLTLTEKKVINQQTNQAFDNLYWAE